MPPLRSDDVRADAYAGWDKDRQEWFLLQTFHKGAYCGNCDGETRIDFKDLPSSQPTLFELKDDDRPIIERNVASPL